MDLYKNLNLDKINIVDNIFEQQAKVLADCIKQAENMKIIGEKMLEMLKMLKDYEFRVDKQGSNTQIFTLGRNIFSFINVETTTGAW